MTKTKRDLLTRWLLPALVLLIVVAARAPFHLWPMLDSDEGFHLTIAQIMLNGGRLYADAWDHKPIGLYLPFLPVIAVFGNNIFAVRIFATSWVVITTAVVYAAARRVVTPAAAVVTMLVYGAWFGSQDFAANAANGELLMMLPAALAIWLWLRAEQRSTLVMMPLAGVLAAATMLTKPTGLLTVTVIPLGMLLYTDFRSRTSLWRRAWIIALFGLGFAAPHLATIGFHAAQGTLADYWQMYSFNSSYVSAIPFTTGLARMLGYWRGILTHGLVLLPTLATLTVVALPGRNMRARGTALALLALLALSLAGVVLGRRTYTHYMLQLALPFAAVCGLALDRLQISPERTWRVLSNLLPAVLVAALGANLLRARQDVMHTAAFHAQDERLLVADYIAGHTPPATPIYVNDLQPVLYFFSNRPPAHRYFTPVYATPEYGALDAGSILTEALTRAPPEVVVDDPTSQFRLAALDPLLAEAYVLEAEIGRYRVYRHAP